MTYSQHHTITDVTRRAIFKSLQESYVVWWGESSEADLLGKVFDLESMPSYDSRLPDADHDIRAHRDTYHDWDNDWLFNDERFDLLNQPDDILLRLFEVMVHPTTQPDRRKSKQLADLLNSHLVFDGWRLEQVSSLSGRPIFEAHRCEPKDPDALPKYSVPENFEVDLESWLYSVSRVFAHRGDTTEVAIIAEASAVLEQSSFDNWQGGTYGYTLTLQIPPALYAQIADTASEYANSVRGELALLFPPRREIHDVVIQPFQRAPGGWQERARVWTTGKGLSNQGRVRSTNIAGREHDGLLFRSQPEINLYEALKKRGVAFAPLPVFLKGGDSYQRLEPDFIVMKDGVFAVVEVDGDSFHPETPAAARTRLKLLEDAGAYIIRVTAGACSTPEFAEACAEDILNDMATHKSNRR